MPSSASVTFVEQLYQSILLRPGSTGEIDAWATFIDSGVLTSSDVATDIANSPEAKAYVAPILSLYETVLQRTPDAAGLQSWVDAYRGGMSLGTITSAFTHSSEYQTLYPLSESNAFVKQLYTSILQRSGTTGEIAAWANAISSGAVTPQQAENDIATSPEAAGTVLPVERLYLATYHVMPDAATLSQDLNAFRGGESLSALATGFVQPDAIQRTIATEWLAGTFVSAQYQSILGRAPDPAGYNNWVDYLDANGNTLAAKAQVILGLANSAEYVADTTATFETTLSQLVNPNDYFGSIDAAFVTDGVFGGFPTFTEFPVFHTNLVITTAAPQVIVLPTATTAGSGGIWLRDPNAPYSELETIAVTGKSYAGLNTANPASGDFVSGYDQIANFDANGRTDQIALTTNYAATLVNGSPNAGVLATVSTGGIDVSGGSAATGYFIPDGVFFVTHTGAVDLTNLSSVEAAIGNVKTSPAPEDKFVVILDNGSSASNSTEFGVYEVTAGEPSGHLLGAGANPADTVKLLELVQAPGGFSTTNYAAPVTGVDAPSGGPSVTLNVIANQTFTTGAIPIVTTANFTVAPGASVTLGNGTAGDFNADPLETVTVSGGSATSTFSVNDSKGVFDNSDFSTFDASGFAGSVQLSLVSSLSGPRFFYAGQGSANSLAAFTGSDASGTPTVVGFQTVTVDGGGIDMRGFMGVHTLNWVIGGSFDIVDLQAGITVGLGDPTGQLQSSTTYNLGLGIDSAYLSIDDGAYPDAYSLPSITFNLNTQGLGTQALHHYSFWNPALNIRVDSPSIDFVAPTVGIDAGQSFNLALTDDTSGPLVVTFEGGITNQTIMLSGLSATQATIDASDLAADLLMLGGTRATNSPAMTITGGTGWNSIELANAGDVLNGGTSGHNTLVVDAATDKGAITIDLSVAAGQNEVTSFDGAATLPVVTNFANVDLSSLAGPNGATVIASPNGSMITASPYGDTIVLSPTGAGPNTIILDETPTPGIAIAGATPSTTFGAYATITNFDAAGRTDLLSLFARAYQSVVSVDKGTIPANVSYTSVFFIDNATATLTNVASVVSAIGPVTTSYLGYDLLVILDDPTSTHFGVYDIAATENRSPLGTYPSDTIKLLAIFDHGFSAASYHAPV